MESNTLLVVDAALSAGELNYARNTLEDLLREQPGHLAGSVALARTLLLLGQAGVAESQLTRVIQADPEDADAWAVLSQVREARSQRAAALNAAAAALALAPDLAQCEARVAALAAGVPPTWLAPFRAARVALAEGRYADARTGAAASCAYAIDPLPAVTQLEAYWRMGDGNNALRLAEQLMQDTSRLVKPRLILAELLLARGENERGVALLHEAAGLDPAGQVAARLWGVGHRFASLWSARESAPGSAPLPASVAVLLGWNQLAPAPPAPPAAVPAAVQPVPAVPNATAPVPAAPVTDPEQAAAPQADPAGTFSFRSGETQPLPPLPAVDAREAAARAAKKRAASARLVASVLKDVQADLAQLGRPQKRAKTPVTQAYLMITSRARLVAKYGEPGFAQIEERLRALEREVKQSRPDLAPGIVFVDDARSLKEFGLNPIDPQNAWAVKSMINDLDVLVRHETRDKSEIASVLIVGGDDVIAHHRLPNPADDSDPEVLSDNPYATRDDNYFVAERAVGRIPDGAGDLPLLCAALDAAIAAHRSPPPAPPAWWRVLLARVFPRLLPPDPGRGQGIGYTASIWRRASLLAFGAVADARRVRICPPTSAEDFPAFELPQMTFAYFNLHGVPDGPNWYGQRDPMVAADYAAFPVALSPHDLKGQSPRSVYSEACYGAAVNGRTRDDSIALRLLANGAQAVVASTCIAYGGVSQPLVGADLLGSLFWQQVLQGTPAGEALRRAKLALAHIMQQKQQALDGEDQKTLISFVFYGDPTIRISPPPAGDKQPHVAWDRMEREPALECSKDATVQQAFEAPVELVTTIKQQVAHYLPGMESAELRCSAPHSCRGKHAGHECPSQTLGPSPAAGANRLVFTLQKSIRSGDHEHARIVRVTADTNGQVLKVAMSK